MKRVILNGWFLLGVGFLSASAAYLSGSSSLVWIAIIGIVGGVMRLRIGSSIVMEQSPISQKIIGGGGDNGSK